MKPSLSGLTCHLALMAFLLTSAIAKIASGYVQEFSVPRFAFHAATLLEISAACTLPTRHWKWASFSAVVIAILGVLFTLTHPRSGCGCIGNLTPSDWRLRLALLGTLGCLGVLSYMQPAGIGSLLRSHRHSP